MSNPHPLPALPPHGVYIDRCIRLHRNFNDFKLGRLSWENNYYSGNNVGHGRDKHCIDSQLNMQCRSCQRKKHLHLRLGLKMLTPLSKINTTPYNYLRSQVQTHNTHYWYPKYLRSPIVNKHKYKSILQFNSQSQKLILV